MRISGHQLFWMVVGMEVGMSLLLTITPAIQKSEQDAWLSMLVAGGIAIIIGYISTRLGLLYPDKTIVEYSQIILGKWLGKLVMIAYFIQWYTVIGIILRQFSELIQTTILQKTPSLAIMLPMLFIVSYATYCGLEGIARTSEVLAPVAVFIILLVVILSFSNVNFSKILPIYTDSGWEKIIEGSFPPASFFGEIVMVTMFIPFLSDSKKAFKGLYGLIFAVFLIFSSTFITLMTICINCSSKMWYPFFEMTKIASLFDFFENVDAGVIVIWLNSIFIKLSMYMFMASYGTAQWLNIKNWRPLVWMIAPIVLLLAYFPDNVDEASVLYPQLFWVPYVFPINMIGIPLLLWIVGSIRKKRKKFN